MQQAKAGLNCALRTIYHGHSLRVGRRTRHARPGTSKPPVNKAGLQSDQALTQPSTPGPRPSLPRTAGSAPSGRGLAAPRLAPSPTTACPAAGRSMEQQVGRAGGTPQAPAGRSEQQQQRQQYHQARVMLSSRHAFREPARSKQPGRQVPDGQARERRACGRTCATVFCQYKARSFGPSRALLAGVAGVPGSTWGQNVTTVGNATRRQIN